MKDLRQILKNESATKEEIEKASKSLAESAQEIGKIIYDAKESKDAKEAKMITENLLYILLTLSKIMAPFTPFMAEEMYLFIKDFSKAELKESVHLETWPENISISLGGREEILAKMQKTREVIEIGLAERNKESIKVRQPLASFTVPGEMYDQLHHDIMEDELNVKKVIQGEIQEAFKLDMHITEDLRLEGLVRDITREIQAERKNMNLVPEDKVEVVVYTDEPKVEKDLQDIYKTVGAIKIIVETVETKADTKVIVKKA